MINLKLLSFCLALFLVQSAFAIQNLVVFGDSLSDNGRLSASLEAIIQSHMGMPTTN
jgi:phospholipase/lecithinase/hemolysin